MNTRPCLLAAASCLAAFPLRAATAVSNLGQPFQNTVVINKDVSEAISFTTGAASITNLSSIIMNGFSFGVEGVFSNITLSLYEGINVSGPSGLVTAFNGIASLGPGNNYSFAPATPTTLAANSTYWLVASAPGAATNASFAWAATAATGEDSGGLPGWSIGNARWVTTNGGASWFAPGSPIPQFQVVSAEPALVITSQPTPQSAFAGGSVTLSVTATGTPAPSFQWRKDGVPIPGATSSSLNLNSVSMSQAGNYSVVVSNRDGSVTSQPVAVSVLGISAQPTSQSVVAGSNVTLSVAAAGNPAPTFQWRKDGVALLGATNNSLNLISVSANTAGTYSVMVSYGATSLTSQPAILDVLAITAQPARQSAMAGSNVVLSVTATGNPTPSFQWRKDGAALPGATSSNLTLNSVSRTHAGTYTVIVSNSAGSVTSAAAILDVIPSSALANISVRTTMTAGQVLIVGAVLSGEKNILVRAAGPALNTFGLQGMADPRLELFTSGTLPTATNDDWPASLSTTFASVAAFPFPTASKDAALSQSLAGSFTVQASGAIGGAVLVEAYDVAGGTSSRLVNFSVRNRVRTGSDILIAGITISGTGIKQVLIRAVGPGLAALGVTGTLTDPLLQVFDASGAVIGTNDNWDSPLAPTFAQVGAFPLPADSRDSVLLLSLNAGTPYTVQVSGVGGTEGEALFEVYEIF